MYGLAVQTCNRDALAARPFAPGVHVQTRCSLQHGLYCDGRFCRSVEGVPVCRAENYETEESSKEVITFEEERQRQLVFLIPLSSQSLTNPLCGPSPESVVARRSSAHRQSCKTCQNSTCPEDAQFSSCGRATSCKGQRWHIQQVNRTGRESQEY